MSEPKANFLFVSDGEIISEQRTNCASADAFAQGAKARLFIEVDDGCFWHVWVVTKKHDDGVWRVIHTFSSKRKAQKCIRAARKLMSGFYELRIERRLKVIGYRESKADIAYRRVKEIVADAKEHDGDETAEPCGCVADAEFGEGVTS